jgi:ribonuclease R
MVFWKRVLAARAERDSIKFKIEYLEDKLGQVFDGMVSGVTDWGMYVELIESKCGMVRYDKL